MKKISGFVLQGGNSTDYIDDYNLAKEQNSFANFKLTMNILNLTQFIESRFVAFFLSVDPRRPFFLILEKTKTSFHQAEAIGQINVKGFTNGFQDVLDGVFNLFVMENKNERLMEYYLPFVGNTGMTYALSGVKYLRTDTCLHVWHDCTTLYSHVLDLANDNQVVATGILEIGVPGVISLVETMRITNAQNPQQTAQGVEAFGKLFFGDIFDTCF